jgi:hypothetical protein
MLVLTGTNGSDATSVIVGVAGVDPPAELIGCVYTLLNMFIYSE